MQITLKTLQQQTFRIDIDPEQTVRARAGAGSGSGVYVFRAPSLSGLAACSYGRAPRLRAEGALALGREGRALPLGDGRAASAGGRVDGASVRAWGRGCVFGDVVEAWEEFGGAGCELLRGDGEREASPEGCGAGPFPRVAARRGGPVFLGVQRGLLLGEGGSS